MTYELEVTLHRKPAKPFRVTGLESAERVGEAVGSFLACWGVPTHSLLNANLAERLADTGVYRVDTTDYQIFAKRSGEEA